MSLDESHHGQTGGCAIIEISGASIRQVAEFAVGRTGATKPEGVRR